MADSYTPTDGLKNTVSFPSKPGSGAAARAQIQGMLDQMLAFHNTHLADNINAHGLTNKSDKIEPARIDILSGFASGWTGSIYYRKNQEGLVTVLIDLKNNVDIVAGTTTLYTMPVGFRPNSIINKLLNIFSSGGGSIANSFANLFIDQSGNINLYPVTGTSLTSARWIYAVEFNYYV